jgi:hypothetical protein
MKLKLAVLVGAALAGTGSSVALADYTAHGDHGKKCKAVHLNGTLAAQSLSLTVAKGNRAAGVQPGTAVSLVLPAGARAKAEACSDGTTLTLRHVEIEVKAPKPAATTTTTQTTTTTTP